MSDYRTLLVPFDFSVHARAALFAATDLAKRLSADLHLIHVVQPPAYAYGYAGIGAGGVRPAIDIQSPEEEAEQAPSMMAFVEPTSTGGP